VNDFEIYVIIIVAVIWFLIAQQVTLNKTEATNDKLYDTLHGLAEGKLEAKIDTDGDLAIRLKPDQLGEK
jgi:hypothetical protein